MRVAITGAAGFLGRNLELRLREAGHESLPITRGTPAQERVDRLATADAVMHAAGVNRPETAEGFGGNPAAARDLVAALTGRPVPIVHASSVRAAGEDAYGRSKRAAEDVLLGYARATGAPLTIFRLTNVFGKWSRPNYNSVVATFCHQAARALPLSVADPASPLALVYVDDVCDAFLAALASPPAEPCFAEAGPIHRTSVGALAEAILALAAARAELRTLPVGTGFLRALNATFLSHLPPADFSYRVPLHGDGRGVFAEMLKTEGCGQVSYFTAGPGVMRGGHYHHTKAEKFLVVAGTARFGFRSLLDGTKTELTVAAGEGRVVETVPGWAHEVTNVGSGDLVCLLWASEVYDRGRPDTIPAAVGA